MSTPAANSTPAPDVAVNDEIHWRVRVGTANCPICTFRQPHVHTAAEVIEYVHNKVSGM